MLSSCGTHHTFLIYHSLLRHAASRRLGGPGEAARCVELGLEAGAALEPGYSLTALVVGLTELPRAWGAALTRGPRQPNLQVGWGRGEGEGDGPAGCVLGEGWAVGHSEGSVVAMHGLRCVVGVQHSITTGGTLTLLKRCFDHGALT